MFTKKKKIIILASMLLMLIVTGFLNVKLNAMSEESSQSVSSEYNAASFFSTYREDRNATRNESIAYYDSIISSTSSSSEAIKSAEEKRELFDRSKRN